MRRWRFWLLALLCLGSIGGPLGCSTTRPVTMRSQPTPDRPGVATGTERSESNDSRRRIPLPDSGAEESGTGQIRLVRHQAPATEIEPLPPVVGAPLAIEPPAEKTYPIDLPTALQLADAENLQVALAREQLRQAYAGQSQAEALWLPSLRGGVHWNRHEGTLQDSSGRVIDVSRSSLYAGAGGQAVGAGSPMIPGLFANFHLADAIFQPLAAQQRVGARQRGADVVRNNTLLEVSLAYMELLRAAEDVGIARDAHQNVRQLSSVTEAYARTGQGLQADAERVRVELALRQNDVHRAEESLAMASARLAQLLRLDPCVRLEPLEPAVVPLDLVTCDGDCCELVAQALNNRPELMQHRYLVGEAVERMRRERIAPLVPSLWLGASYGGFGGGQGDTVTNFQDRFDFDATAYWELRNLGLGEAAARRGAQSQVRQAQLQQMSVMDQVAREVVEAHAQVQARERQINIARGGVKAAVDSHRHNLSRIQEGQGLPIEVLQSTQALLQARREYLRSVIDFNSAQFSLNRALGWPVGQ